MRGRCRDAMKLGRDAVRSAYGCFRRIVDELQYEERHRDDKCVALFGLTTNMHLWTHEGASGMVPFILRLGSTQDDSS
jgi:hypothetical protein